MSKYLNILFPLAGLLGMLCGLATAQVFGGGGVPGKVWVLDSLIGLGIGLGLVLLARSEEKRDQPTARSSD